MKSVSLPGRDYAKCKHNMHEIKWVEHDAIQSLHWYKRKTLPSSAGVRARQNN